MKFCVFDVETYIYEGCLSNGILFSRPKCHPDQKLKMAAIFISKWPPKYMILTIILSKLSELLYKHGVGISYKDTLMLRDF